MVQSSDIFFLAVAVKFAVGFGKLISDSILSKV